MFQSLSVMNPKARFDDIDIVINRNSLAYLLRLANGNCQKSFRLDLTMVHNTLIVTPVWEKITEGRSSSDYGREFEDLFVDRSPDLQDSSTHHRAIRYNLGPLNCAVLLEIDAALYGFDELMASPGHKKWKFLPKPKGLTPDMLSKEGQPQTDAEMSLFRSLDLENFAIPKAKHYPHSMVIPRGRGTLSVNAAELVMTKGRSSKKTTQLWLGRTPYCVRGSHMDEKFTQVNVIYYGSSFRAFETDNQNSLQRLVSLIRQLKHCAINATNQSCVVICNKTIKPLALRVFDHEQTPPSSLPQNLRSHFWSAAEARN